MTVDETIDLLTIAAAFDRRTVGEADVTAWQAVLGDLPFADARESVIAHYRDSREWVMPADIRTRVKAMRRARLEHAIVPAPAPELADGGAPYREALRSGIRKLANGLQDERLAIAAPVRPGPPPEVFTQARARLGASIEATREHLAPEEIARRQAGDSRADRARRGDPIPETDVA